MKKTSNPQRSSKAHDTRGKENAAMLPRIEKTFAIMFRQQSYPPGKPFAMMKQLIEAVSGKEEEDQVSESTMRRVLDAMRDYFNLPVAFIPERNGHGFTEPVSHFPLDVISEEQVYYLIQSVQMLRVHKNSKAFREIRRAVKKACLGITLMLGVEFEEIEKALSFHVVGFDAPAPVDPELFKAAMRAILNKQEVTLEHRSVKRRGEVKKKTVEPLHLSMINHALYLWHHDPELEGKRDAQGRPVDPIRKFALTRIGELKPTRRKCKARKFDVHERVQRGMGVFDGDEIEEVELRFSAKIAPIILERKWHPSQVVTSHADSGITMGLRVAVSPELESFVMRWAGEVEVVSPRKLRGRMQELGEALAGMHCDGRADLQPV